jgi:hypothetical protein
MGILQSITKGGNKRAPKLLIYGPPASGKTTFAASGPNPLIVDCENGAGYVHCAVSPYLDKWADIESLLNALLWEQHDYRVVAIDTIDWCLRRIEEAVTQAGSGMEKTIQNAAGGYGNGRLVMRNYVYQKLLPMLDGLTQRKVAVVLLAHARLVHLTDEGVAVKKGASGPSTQKAAPDIADGFLETFVEWADMVGYIEVNGDSRALVVDDQPRVLAKNRMAIPNMAPLSWETILGKRKDAE